LDLGPIPRAGRHGEVLEDLFVHVAGVQGTAHFTGRPCGAQSRSAMWLSENRSPCRSTPTTTGPRPVQVSSHLWSSRSSRARGARWRKPRAARSVARRRSVTEMIAACSSSIDAAREPRRGPASQSSQLGGARGSTAGLSAAAAMTAGSWRLVAPQAACRRPSGSVSASRLEQEGGGPSRDEPPERGDGAGADREQLEERAHGHHLGPRIRAQSTTVAGRCIG
jgi:hypothetical protein